MSATVRKIAKASGVAGQVCYSAFVTYPGEDERVISFIGSVYGGPVVMRTEIMGRDFQTFVSEPDRFGPFGREWVARFFEEA